MIISRICHNIIVLYLYWPSSCIFVTDAFISPPCDMYLHFHLNFFVAVFVIIFLSQVPISTSPPQPALSPPSPSPPLPERRSSLVSLELVIGIVAGVSGALQKLVSSIVFTKCFRLVASYSFSSSPSSSSAVERGRRRRGRR